MLGQVDNENSDLVNYMVTSQPDKSFAGLNRSQKVDRRGRCGTCNVCSAPCSSCRHVDKVMLKSNGESTIEACAENIVVADHRQYESGQMSEISNASGSFSEHLIGKGSSNMREALESDDNVVHSEHGVSEAHDDCSSCASGTDELASIKDELKDSLTKYNRKGKVSIDSPNQVALNDSLAVLSLQVERPLSKNTNDVPTVLPKESSLCSKKDRRDNKPSDTKDKPYDSPTLTSVLNREAENVVCGDNRLSETISITNNEDMDVEAPPTDEADDLGMMEVDVNICDICGDAGREHLLAVCSRCSDGAEHTYCMREKLDELPKDEWLCEECSSMMEKDNGRQAKTQKLDDNEKVNVCNRASSELANGPDFERNRANDEIRRTGKRRRDDADAEVSSIVKKPTTMQTISSPKTTNIGRRAPSSLDNSLKNQDKGRLKSFHLSSSNTVRASDIPETENSDLDLRSRSFRGTFSKSMSFNSLAPKPKPKLVDQVVLQRQKSATEHASFRPKDGVTRLMGKSMSFKSTVSARSESKTKMLSPRLSHIQDNRNINGRSSTERQRSFRSEQPLAKSIVGNSKNAKSRIDKPTEAQGEPSMSMAIVNQLEKKYVNTDTKSVALPRSSSFVARRSIKSSSSFGEVKRSSVSTFGVSYAIGCNNIGQKSSRTGPKEDAERPHNNANDGERIKEQLGSRFKPPSRRSSTNELKRPGVHRKNKMPDRTDDSYLATAGADLVSHEGRISSPTRTRRSNSAVEHPEETKLSRSVTPDSRTISDVKGSRLVNSEGLLSGGDGDGVKLLPSFGDSLNDVSIAGPTAAIPEHEYIWQGSFEINQSGRCFELWDGIQAHLSTRASPKVVHAVKKFESRVTLQEVPRLSIWPVQFQEHGVKEDDIALFFFAKDIESYNKNYKILVDKMMANDFALKGNVNGVELLIFPSTQLPDNMKRWNMLFYIWGVFRGKRESCSVHIPNSFNRSNASQEIPLKSRGHHVEHGLSSSCGPPRSSGGCHMEKLPMEDIPFNSQQSSNTVKSAAGTNCAASEGAVSGNITLLDRVSKKEQLSTLTRDEDSLKDDDTTMLDGETRNEPCGAVETENVWDSARSESLGHGENPERPFFPLETKPVKGSTYLVDRSSPWKIHPLEQDQVHDKLPDLELALWPESKTWDGPIGVDIKAEEDDVSASLSLSLSFPFTEREQRNQPGSRIKPKRILSNDNNTSMLGRRYDSV